MSLKTPKAERSLPATLYSIAAHTGIALDAERLQDVLVDADEFKNETGTLAIKLVIRIETDKRDSIKTAAAQMREIADLLEAAADKSTAAAP